MRINAVASLSKGGWINNTRLRHVSAGIEAFPRLNVTAGDATDVLSDRVMNETNYSSCF